MVFCFAFAMYELLCLTILHLFFCNCSVIVKFYGISLKHSKREFMFTKKEKRLVGEECFTIIRETEQYIEFLSNNTKHYWTTCKNPDGTDSSVMI